MDLNKIKESSTKTIIQGIKDTLKQGLFKWPDTGNLVSYEELLNVLYLKEPVSYEEAKQMYSSLSNDPRITKAQ